MELTTLDILYEQNDTIYEAEKDGGIAILNRMTKESPGENDTLDLKAECR